MSDTPKANPPEVATALWHLGAAYRGDWSNFDGRTLRDQLDGLAEALTGSELFNSSRWLALRGVCPSQSCWVRDCDESAGYDECAHTKAVLGG